MRRLLFILPLLAVSACHPEKKDDATGASQPREGKSYSTTDTKAAGPKKPLLETPRIYISPTGNMIILPTGNSAANADATLADIESLPPSRTRDHATASVISAVAKEDPARALKMLTDWKGALIGEWNDVVISVIRTAAKKEAEATADFIRKEVPPALQGDAWGAFLSQLPADGRPGYLAEIPESHHKLNHASMLMYEWVAQDPQACAGWLDDFAQGRNAEELEMLLDPLGIPGEGTRDATRWLAAYRVAEDPAARRVLAEGVWRNADEATRSSLAAELEESIPALEERARTEAIEKDPAAYAEALSPAEVSDLPAGAVETIIERWARTNPKEALDWAMSHERPEAAVALDSLFYQEPKEAISLVSKLKPGKKRDSALVIICTSTASEGDGDTARSLLPLFSEDRQREAIRDEIEVRLKKREH